MVRASWNNQKGPLHHQQLRCRDADPRPLLPKIPKTTRRAGKYGNSKNVYNNLRLELGPPLIRETTRWSLCLIRKRQILPSSRGSVEWMIMADTYGWDSLTTVRLIANRLCGMARRWYDSQEQLTSNWKNIKKKLIKQFSKRLPFAKLLKEAALYETHNGQDLSEYCYTKLDKLRALKLKIPELQLVDAVISGITNESIARSARASRFTNTN